MKTGVQAQVKAPSQPAFTPVQVGLLQRKCACGGGAGECEECDRKNMSLQRKVAGQGEASTAQGVVHDVLRSTSQPLDAVTRRLMESRFGHDFSKVRVHADRKAAESARAVEALAYTVGNDIVFGSGQYAPHTTSGQRLLAHEMIHVLQQCGTASGSMSSSSLRIGPAGDASESEAHSAEDLIGSSKHPALQSLIGEQVCAPHQPGQIGYLRRRESAAARRGEPLPGQEPIDANERRLFKNYARDCAGVTLIVRRPKDEPPREKIRRLERRLNGLPRVVPRREAIEKQIQDNPYSSKLKEHLRDFDERIIEPEFGKGYALGSLEEELIKAQCELSEIRWMLVLNKQGGDTP